jgi:hypothetical protein
MTISMLEGLRIQYGRQKLSVAPTEKELIMREMED